MIAWLIVAGVILGAAIVASFVVWLIEVVPPWLTPIILLSPIWSFMIWMGHLIAVEYLKKGHL
jgi:hypothetical protein